MSPDREQPGFKGVASESLQDMSCAGDPARQWLYQHVAGGWVGRRWLVLPQVRVRAFCSLTQQEVAEPMVGCGHCQEERWRSIQESLERVTSGVTWHELGVSL